MKNSSQVHQRKRQKFVGKTDRDHISTLPDELLYEILSRLPGKDVVRTSILSKRWVNLWKYTPNLNFSHRGILKLPIRFVQRTMIKVSHQCLKENENGRMIYASQKLDKGKVDVQVQKEEKNNGNVVFMIEMSHKRHSNYKFCFYQPTRLKPSRMYHPPNIVYLELHRYRIHPYLTMMFCESLKTLKLIWVFVETRLLNSILPQCVFLEELVIRHSYNIRDGLRIRNNRLKFLELSGIDADQIQVLGTHLEVLVLDHVSCPAKCFEINAPEIEFKENYRIGPHIYTACNISSEVRETFSYIPTSVLETVGNTGVGYEVLINDSRTLRNVGTLAIKLDFKKQRKILILSDMLKECVCLRTLELKIKENKTAYEDEDDEDCPPWILRSKFWEKQAFPFLEGQLESVSINGFTGSIEETGFTACLVTKAISLKKLTIYFRPCAVQRATKAVMGLLAFPKASKNLAVQLKPEACEREILNDVANYIGSFGFR